MTTTQTAWLDLTEDLHDAGQDDFARRVQALLDAETAQR